MSIIFVIPIGLLYLIFLFARKKKAPFLTLMWIALLVGFTTFLMFPLAAVRVTYSGQKEWLQEKQFFFNILADKLEASGDLKASAAFMQTTEIKERTLVQIQEIVDAFRPQIIQFLSLGGFVLALSVSSLWFRGISTKKYYPYLLVLIVLLGGLLFDMGVFYRQYASRTDKQLKHFLRCQQEILMNDLSKLQTDKSIPEMAKIIREQEDSIYGYGQYLPNLLRTEKLGNRN